MAKYTKAKVSSFNNSNRYYVIIVGVFALLSMIIISLAFGAVKIPVIDLVTFNFDEIESSVLYQIRLPRILTAVIVGSALAISGACLQTLFRNPLADPSIIGISSGAALAVGISIVLIGDLTDFFGVYGLSFFAFIGAVLASFFVFRITKISGRTSVTYMLLAGIAINAIAAAGTGFLAFISTDSQLRTLTFWTMGSFSGSMWESVIVASSIVIPAIFILYKYSRQLNIILLGDEEAEYLGIDVEVLKRKIIILVTLIVGCSVAISGIIGFIGLIVPHLLRLSFGSDNRFIVPAAAIFGALLMLVSDGIARTIFSPTEMPVGIVTSLIGGPYFLFLLVSQSKMGVK